MTTRRRWRKNEDPKNNRSLIQLPCTTQHFDSFYVPSAAHLETLFPSSSLSLSFSHFCQWYLNLFLCLMSTVNCVIHTEWREVKRQEDDHLFESWRREESEGGQKRRRFRLEFHILSSPVSSKQVDSSYLDVDQNEYISSPFFRFTYWYQSEPEEQPENI